MIWMLAAWGADLSTVTPALAPADVVARYAAAVPNGAPLACEVLWLGHASVCFKVDDNGRKRFVTTTDLTAWKTPLETLKRQVAPRVEELARNEPHPESVVDMDARYWTAVDSNGWAGGLLLAPDKWLARVGAGEVRVAVPRASVILAWPAGSSDLDRIMAIAAREMYEAADDAVTPTVHAWNGRELVPFATARPESKGTDPR